MDGPKLLAEPIKILLRMCSLMVRRFESGGAHWRKPRIMQVRFLIISRGLVRESWFESNLDSMVRGA